MLLDNPDDRARFVDTGQLAALLGMSRRSVYRLMERGMIPPPTRRGNANRFDLDECIRHAETMDPMLSVQLAAERGWRSWYFRQLAKVWGLRSARYL